MADVGVLGSYDEVVGQQNGVVACGVGCGERYIIHTGHGIADLTWVLVGGCAGGAALKRPLPLCWVVGALVKEVYAGVGADSGGVCLELGDGGK